MAGDHRKVSRGRWFCDLIGSSDTTFTSILGRDELDVFLSPSPLAAGYVPLTVPSVPSLFGLACVRLFPLDVFRSGTSSAFFSWPSWRRCVPFTVPYLRSPLFVVPGDLKTLNRVHLCCRVIEKPGFSVWWGVFGSWFLSFLHSQIKWNSE